MAPVPLGTSTQVAANGLLALLGIVVVVAGIVVIRHYIDY